LQIRENGEFFYSNRRQVVTSSTRPTGVEGLEIYETDTDRVLVYDGTNWTRTAQLGAANTWTPTWTQNGNVTKTVNVANYWKIGRVVYGELFMTATGAGGSSVAMTVSMPDTMVYSGSPAIVLGSGSVVDASGGPVFYAGALLATSTTALTIQVHNSLAAVGAAPAFTIASGDTISMSFRYYSTTVT